MTYIPRQSAPEHAIPASSGVPSGSTAERFPARVVAFGRAAVQQAGEINARHAPTALRIALAMVFLWFGALKITGTSPVRALIASTLPFIDPHISVPALGLIEVVIGLALLIGRFPRITLLVLVGHLAGTFLTFVTASRLMIDRRNPWELTADGEFVIKNLVLISAALLLVGWYTRSASRATGD